MTEGVFVCHSRRSLAGIYLCLLFGHSENFIKSHSVIPTVAFKNVFYLFLFPVTLRSAKRADAFINRRPLSEPCELGRPSETCVGTFQWG